MKENKILWSLDLAVTINDCDENAISQNSIIKFGKKISNTIDPEAEIVGIVNPFGDHNEDMKGWRLIHENKNSLITAHFIEKSKKAISIFIAAILINQARLWM
jgi:hypothetical protein